MLSTPDLKKLFGLYDYLALPPEVLMMLLNYCVSLERPVRQSPLHALYREGGLRLGQPGDPDARAGGGIHRRAARGGRRAAWRGLLGIRGRADRATERKFLTAWLEMGFDDELIEMALDRTVTNTGGLKWGYMNGILKSWHEKGLHTAGGRAGQGQPPHRRKRAGRRKRRSGADKRWTRYKPEAEGPEGEGRPLRSRESCRQVEPIRKVI